MNKLSISSLQKFHQNPAVYKSLPRLKESFKETYKILTQESVQSVLDVGCAAGDFLYYLPSKIKGVGVDNSKELITIARKRVKRNGIQFVQRDFLKNRIPGKFDAVTLLGVMHTFLDFRPILDHALSYNPSIVIVHSPFNDLNVDAQHFHRVNIRDTFQCAYSIFSKQTVGHFLASKNISNYSFIPSVMKVMLPFDSTNPLRNWHVMIRGQKRLTNGIGILFDEYFLVIKP